MINEVGVTPEQREISISQWKRLMTMKLLVIDDITWDIMGGPGLNH